MGGEEAVSDWIYMHGRGGGGRRLFLTGFKCMGGGGGGGEGCF